MGTLILVVMQQMDAANSTGTDGQRGMQAMASASWYAPTDCDVVICFVVHVYELLCSLLLRLCFLEEIRAYQAVVYRIVLV